MGLPVLLTAAGLILNALAAIVAFSVAVIAVWIATSSDVQAKLMVIQPYRRDFCSHTGEHVMLAVDVINHGTRVDVTFVGLVVERHDFEPWPRSGPQIPVVAPPGDALDVAAEGVS